MTKSTATDNMKEIAKNSANNNKVTKHKGTLAVIKNFTDDENVKKRFADTLQKNPSAFLSSIISLVSSSTNFDGVDPNTIMMGAMQAATLDLPINPNLGFAYIIPYSGKAQFQLGWKGFVQLALRTGQYKTINTTEVYEGQLISRNRMTGEVVILEESKTSDKIVGYVAYFRLNNGFEKSHYMSMDELIAHGKRYSKSFGRLDGPWKTNQHAMMLKTPLKLLLSKFGILSVQMQQAITADQAVVTENEDGEISYEYVDSDSGTTEESSTNVAEDKKSEVHPLVNDYIKDIKKLMKEEEVDGWEKENNDELTGLGKEDQEKIAEAILGHRSFLREVSRVNTPKQEKDKKK